MKKDKLYILGAGTPTPTASRFGSAYVLDIDGEKIMFDCGPAATHKLVKSGLWPTEIDYLFFTHHHFDHDIDYPCFLLCRWDQSIGKENMLNVFGPNLTEKITNEVVGEDGAFSHDWKARVYHPVSQKVYVNRGGTLPRKPPKVNANDINPGTNADILVCMCWDDQETMNENGEFFGQCGTLGAAQMAEDANVKTLVLVHMGPNISLEQNKISARKEIAKIFSGNIIFSEEIQSIDIWNK